MRWLDGIINSTEEFEQPPGDDEGQGNPTCCSPWGRKESDMAEWLNISNKNSWTPPPQEVLSNRNK